MITLPFRAVAFDLDDTLLRDNLTLSANTLNTLNRLQKFGVRMIPASGRAQKSMEPFVERIQQIPLYIACNGAEIWSGNDHKLLMSESFSCETGKAIARFGKKWDVYSQTYDGAFFYYNEESVWAERYAKATRLTGKYVGDLESFIQESRNKILMMAEEEKIAQMLPEARLLFQGRASVTCSKPWFLEFNPPEATKGLALQKVCDLMGIPISACIAFGDSLNDLSMLRVAGRGVLMENGRKELRSLCDDICSENEKDGVAEYLKHVFKEVFS